MRDFDQEEYYEKIICELEDKTQVYEKQLFEFEQFIEKFEKDTARLEMMMLRVCDEFGIAPDLITQQYICVYLKESIDEYLDKGWWINPVEEDDYRLGFPDSSISPTEDEIYAVLNEDVPYLENDDYIICRGIVDFSNNTVSPEFKREDIEDEELEIPNQ